VQTRSFAGFGPVNVAQGAKAKLKKQKSRDFVRNQSKCFEGIEFLNDVFEKNLMKKKIRATG
jgi:hypothetical protein